MKKLLLVLAVLPFLFVWTFAYAQEQGQGHWMGPWMMNWGFGMWWIMPFIMIAFWIVVIVGIISLIRWLARSERGREIKSEETALDILKKRYAKGEISKEDFERMKKDIL
jgi:putative membrane protein